MNVLNRLLVILGALVVLIATTAVLLVTGDLVRPQALAPGAWSMDLLALFQRFVPATRSWVLVGCALLIVLGLVLLAWELRPTPHSRRQLLVRQDPLGRVTVAMGGVEELVCREAGRVAGVMEAASRVRQARDGLRIVGRVSVAPDTDVPAVTQELQGRIKSAVERHVGRPVTAVDLITQLAPLSGQRTRRVR